MRAELMKDGIIAEGRTEEMALMASEALEGKLSEGEHVIYSGRNVLTSLESKGVKYALKYFSRSVKNRLVYAIWSSKARRSYLHGLELLKRGISTPQPEAYAEKRGLINLLLSSIYISHYEESEALEDYLKEGEESWREFARFAVELHKKGIIHKDMNCTNVRVKRNGEQTEFSLIDLNRMDILPHGEEVRGERAYKNLVRFSAYPPEFEIFAREYARLMGIGEKGYQRLIAVKKKHEGMKY